MIVDVVTPAAGESVTEGTILEWRVKVGDAIKRDDTIVEISTDKVDVELPSPASGTVSEILVEEGDTVTVGQVIARIAVGERRSAASRGRLGGSLRIGEHLAQPPGSVAAARPPAMSTSGAARRQRAPGSSPPAGEHLGARGLRSLRWPRARPPSRAWISTHVSGSGPAGRIVKADVLGAAAGNARHGGPAAPR